MRRRQLTETGSPDRFGTPLLSTERLGLALARLSISLTESGCDREESAVERAVFSCFLRQLCAGTALPAELAAELAPQGVFKTRDEDQLTEIARLLGTGGQAGGAGLGQVHQFLLAYRLIRLAAPGFCIGPTRTWVQARQLILESPDVRGIVLGRRTGLSAKEIRRLDAPLRSANDPSRMEKLLGDLSCAQEPAGAWVVQPSLERRRAGAHFTPAPLARRVVEAAFGPLVDGLNERALANLRICDPAMGAGVFLLEARRFLAERLKSVQGLERCLFGLDLDPRAVLLTRLGLFLDSATADRSETSAGIKSQLLVGDGLGPGFGAQRFDVVLGNPPWVAYAGRAAQPLDAERAAFFSGRFAAFRGYRTLHGLFIERAAELLSPGGRLALVIPTSVSDLDGYRATRAAHDAWCEVDSELPDFADGAFDGVFQPSMAVLSTRRSKRLEAVGAAWPLARTDISSSAGQLLSRLSALPTVPRELFGERGYQTRPHDRQQLRPFGHLPAEGARALRTGTEVLEFRTLRPRYCVDPDHLQTPLKPVVQWRDVALLIRQTARFPIASPGDGEAFRNSILAGFEHPHFSRQLLLCWLNSEAVRWFHYHAHRDARQGMPQLKIAHLRALPAPPAIGSQLGAALHTLGDALYKANAGIGRQERTQLDSWVCEALQLDKQDRKLVSDWAQKTPPPKPRTRGTAANS